MRSFFNFLLVLIVAFALGFVPMWVMYRNASNRLAAVTHELNLAQAQSALASAMVDVQRGDYEPARSAISTFFTCLRTETDSGAASILSAAQREALQPLFGRQDELITMLARNDAMAMPQLSDLYVSYRTIMNP